MDPFALYLAVINAAAAEYGFPQRTGGAAYRRGAGCGRVRGCD